MEQNTVHLTEADQAEYQRRLNAVQKVAIAEGFDALLVADNDDVSRPPRGRVRYLTNFSLGLRPMAVLVPADGQPTLIVPPGALNCLPKWAMMKSWIHDIRYTPSEEWPPPINLAGDVVETIKSRGFERGRIGVCGDFFQEKEVRERLPQVRFESAMQSDSRGTRRDIVERVRAVKSAWEVHWLEEAQRCTDVGIQAFMATARPGMRHDVAIAEAEYQAKKAGADETMVFMSAGTHPWVWGSYRGDLCFAEGDLVSVEFNARVNGYVAQIARAGALGKATLAQQLLLEAGRESERAMIDRIAIRITGGELWDVGLGVVHKAGLSHYGRYGHGMGLSIVESLDIMPGDGWKVEEGFCVEVHCGLVSMETMDSALIGDQMLVEKGKVRLLSRVPQDLRPSWS